MEGKIGFVAPSTKPDNTPLAKAHRQPSLSAHSTCIHIPQHKISLVADGGYIFAVGEHIFIDGEHIFTAR